MLSILFIFIAITGVIAEEKYDCDESLAKECPFVVRREFPKEEEEFMQFCSSMTGHFECVVAVEEQCQRYLEALAIATEIILPLLRDVCGEDVLLHAAILDNLKCYGDLVDEGPGECLRPREEKIQQYFAALSEKGLVDTHRNMNDTLECLEGILGVACNAVRVERKCGTVAMDAMIEIIRRLAPAKYESCGEEISNFLPTVVLLYKLEEKELEDIQQALKKK